MNKKKFLKLWSREAVNQPGIMLDVTSLIHKPHFDQGITNEIDTSDIVGGYFTSAI